MGWGGGSQGMREEKSKPAPKPGKERAHGTEFQWEMLWETPSALPTGMLCVSTETQQRENHWEGLRSYSRTTISGVKISSGVWRSPEISWESSGRGPSTATFPGTSALIPIHPNRPRDENVHPTRSNSPGSEQIYPQSA